MPRDLLAIAEPRDLLAGTLPVDEKREPLDLLTGQLHVKRETEIQALTPEVKATLRPPTSREEVKMKEHRLLKGRLPTLTPWQGRLTAFLGGAFPLEETKEFTEVYPGAAMTGKAAQLASLSKLTAPVTPAIEKFLWTSPLTIYPKLIPMLAHAVQSASAWGIGGVVDVMSKEPTKETITHPLEEAAFGTLLGGAYGIERTIPRIVAGGVARGGWTAGKKLLQEEGIKKEDLVDIGLNAALGAFFNAINAPAVSRAYKQARLDAFEENQLITRWLVRHPGKTRVDAEKIVDLIKMFSEGTKNPAFVLQAKVNMPLNLNQLPYGTQVRYASELVKNITAKGMSVSDALLQTNKWLSNVTPIDLEYISELVMGSLKGIGTKQEGVAPVAEPVSKEMLERSWTADEFHQLPVEQQQVILDAKLKDAKSVQHAESIKGKYTIEEPTAIGEGKVELGGAVMQTKRDLQEIGFDEAIFNQAVEKGVDAEGLIKLVQSQVGENKDVGVFTTGFGENVRALVKEKQTLISIPTGGEVDILSQAKAKANTLADAQENNNALHNEVLEARKAFEAGTGDKRAIEIAKNKLKLNSVSIVELAKKNQLTIEENEALIDWAFSKEGNTPEGKRIGNVVQLLQAQLSTPTAKPEVTAPIAEGIFNTDSTGVSDYDNLFGTRGNEIDNVDKIPQKEYYAKHKGMVGEVVYMSPDEYLSKIPYQTPSKESAVKIKAAVDAGKKLSMPYLDYSGEGRVSQEGRNRAYVAKEMGVDKIPVLVVNKPGKAAPKDILAPAPVTEINRDLKPTPSEFKTPLTNNDTPSSTTIQSIAPAPQPTKVEKPKPITTWSVVDYPDVALINKSDPDTARIIDSINGRIRNNMLRTVEDYRKGKNPYRLNYIKDTPDAFQIFEGRTGFPLYTKYGVQLSKARNIVAYEVATIINRFTDGLKKGYQTSLSTERIVKYIVKQEGRLTEEERKIATKLMDIFRESKDIVSYLRMRRFIDGAEQVPKDLESIVEEGEKVFVKGGKEALEKWVKGKDIGVVTDDRYFPAQLLRKFRTHYSSDPFEVFNPHVHSRTVEEQMYDYSQSIVQKLHSYLTRMYSDYYMYDLLVDAKNDFSGTDMPYDTINSVKKWMVAIQGKGIEVGWWGQAARKARGQFFKVVLGDPTKWVRNYLQRYYMTLQNYPTLQHAMRTKQYFDYKLTDSELNYFNVHISQLRELEREQLYLYEKIFEKGVLGKVDDLATALARRYTLVDEGNRYVTFKYALASNDKYIKLYKQGKLSLRGMLNKTGASSFYDLELKHILSLPVGEARLEIAKLLVDKTQFRYKKTERGLSALSELGEVATSLLQYPKSVITRYLDAVDMIGRGDSMEDRWAGVRLLVGLILLANVAQSVLEKIVGESKYYDPDLNREVVNDSYGLVGVIGSVQIAGAQPAHAVILAKTVKRISDLLYLEASKTMPSDSYRMTAIRAILKDVDQLGEAYIPFLRIAMNGVEAVEGTRSHKLLTTFFDQKTRRQTALRRNKIQRNWVEAWSHFLFSLERKKKEAGGLWR